MKLRNLMFCSIFAVGLVPAATFAQPGNPQVLEAQTQKQVEQQKEKLEERKKALQERLEKAEERLEEQRARRCEFAKTRLEFHRDKAAEVREHRKQRYQNIVDRLNILADRMDNSGLNSTELRAKIVELTNLISQYSSFYTEYEAALQSAINIACSSSDEAKEALKAAREILIKLRSNAEVVHEFFQDQIKPALETIQEDVKEQGQTSEENEAENQNNKNESEEL